VIEVTVGLISPVNDVGGNLLNNTKDSTMQNKKQSKKQAKTLPLTTLPVVKLDDKDMSSVSGGGSIGSV
jgi:hypothetical protein